MKKIRNRAMHVRNVRSGCSSDPLDIPTAKERVMTGKNGEKKSNRGGLMAAWGIRSS